MGTLPTVFNTQFFIQPLVRMSGEHSTDASGVGGLPRSIHQSKINTIILKCFALSGCPFFFDI
jgi:hypothetical protein